MMLLLMPNADVDPNVDSYAAAAASVADDVDANANDDARADNGYVDVSSTNDDDVIMMLWLYCYF